MSAPAIVLIHGGSMNARYWDLVVPRLDFPALAVDLPGRGAHPADVNDLEIADWAESVARDVEKAGLEQIVLVGNSLAGITMPGVATRLPKRVRHLVFSSCTVPAPGRRTVDYLRPDIRELVAGLEEAVTSGRLRLTPDLQGGDGLASTTECIGDDAPDELARFLEVPIRRTFPEAIAVFYERFSWEGFPCEVPRTYLKSWRDRLVPPDLQDAMIRNMGGARVIELDGPHCPAVRHPDVVAALLNGIAAGIRNSSR